MKNRSNMSRQVEAGGLHTRLVVLFSALGTLLLAACPRPPTTTDAPPQDAPRAAQADIYRGLDRAREECEELETIPFLARFNPVSCDCPDWEILMWGRWTRVSLSAGSSTSAALEALDEAAAERAGVIFAVSGRVRADALRSEDTGMVYPGLNLTEYGGPLEP